MECLRSFGVVCWEIFSDGDRPYGTANNAVVFNMITKSRTQLAKPSNCPSEFYVKIMKVCFLHDLQDRPFFEDIVSTLQHLLSKSHVDANKTVHGLDCTIWVKPEPPTRHALTRNGANVEQATSPVFPDYCELLNMPSCDNRNPDALSVIQLKDLVGSPCSSVSPVQTDPGQYTVRRDAKIPHPDSHTKSTRLPKDVDVDPVSSNVAIMNPRQDCSCDPVNSQAGSSTLRVSKDTERIISNTAFEAEIQVPTAEIPTTISRSSM